MKNFKKKLSAIMALGLVSTVAYNVTACGYNKPILNLPVGVTSALNLTDIKGNPKITPTLLLNKTSNNYYWTSNLPAITGKSFVNKDLSAINDDCSSLLKTTFKLSPDINGRFNSDQLDQITSNIHYLPKISKNLDNDDFYVSGGTLELQFFKDNFNISQIYTVNLKSDFNADAIISHEFYNLTFSLADFDTSGSANLNPLFNGPDGFKIGENVKDLTDKECYLWKEDSEFSTNNDKIINSLNKILGTKITINVLSQSKTDGKWSDKDFITVEYTFTIGHNNVTILHNDNLFPNPL